MPSTYTLISSNVLASSAASVTFSAIPSTYTDLVLRISSRDDNGVASATILRMQLNGLTTSIFSRTQLVGTGSAAVSIASTANDFLSAGYENSPGSTSSTFSSIEIYIPSYLSSTKKPISGFSVQENNTTAANLYLTAGLADLTSTITSILLFPTAGNFVSGSSFYLYGIKNS